MPAVHRTREVPHKVFHYQPQIRDLPQFDGEVDHVNAKAFILKLENFFLEFEVTDRTTVA